jgi:transposase-like protein
MKSKKAVTPKPVHRKHSPQFKQLAVDRSDKESVAIVAVDLGISDQFLQLEASAPADRQGL